MRAVGKIRRKTVALSAIGLAVASAAGIVALVVAPHTHGPGVSAGANTIISPAPRTPAVSPSPARPAKALPPKPRPSNDQVHVLPIGNGTAALPAQNLTIPSDVRQQLLTAFVAAKKAKPSEISGPSFGSVYFGYLPATSTYWAVAGFALTPSAAYQTMVDFQDGGSIGIFHHRAGQPWQVTIGGYPWPCPGDLPNAMRLAWNMSINPDCSIVDAVAPNAPRLTKFVTLADGTYYGAINMIQYDYNGLGYLTVDPYTWLHGSAPVDNQPGIAAGPGVDSTTTTQYGDASQAGVIVGVFDAAFARRVAESMSAFAGQLTDGYVFTVKGQHITAVTQIGPQNPMPANHPDYFEPQG